MTFSFILISVSLLALVLLLGAVRKRGMTVRRVEDLPGCLRPVDLEAFRNLVDPEEEQLLRMNLSCDEFRGVQRDRLRAAAQYVSCAAYNAGILLRLGTVAVHSPDPRVAEAGRELVDKALHLRWYALLALSKLYVGWLLPGSQLSPAGIADMYQQLDTSLTHFGRVLCPARGARISATV